MNYKPILELIESIREEVDDIQVQYGIDFIAVWKDDLILDIIKMNDTENPLFSVKITNLSEKNLIYSKSYYEQILDLKHIENHPKIKDIFISNVKQKMTVSEWFESYARHINLPES